MIHEILKTQVKVLKFNLFNLKTFVQRKTLWFSMKVPEAFLDGALSQLFGISGTELFPFQLVPREFNSCGEGRTSACT